MLANKPWLKRQWVIPAVGAQFVWRMEDLLDLYAEPLDPAHPLVCFDETTKQLVAEFPETPERDAKARGKQINEAFESLKKHIVRDQVLSEGRRIDD